jgi:2-dehydropantoate 2-reductase
MAKDLKIIKFGVLGPGAVGSLLTASLCKSGFDVTCFGTQRAAVAILKDGIRVKSVVFGDFVTYPKFNSSSHSLLDVIFVTVKAPALSLSLKSIMPYVGPNTIFVTLLNGIGHRETIQQTFGHRVAIGVIGLVEVSLDEDRVVLHRSKMIPHIEIASNFDVDSEILSSIALTLRQCGFSVLIGDNENQVIWSKLVRLAAIASLGAYSQKNVGDIRSETRLRNLLEAIVNELCQIAKTQNVQLSAIEVMHKIDNLPASLTTSLQRDVEAGRASELESILGEPLRLGNLSGISIPVIEYCYSSILERIKVRTI